MSDSTLDVFRKQFAYYRSLGEQTLVRVPDERLFWQPNAESNSLATVVKHLAGNMLSRWTDFLDSDGEKDWRDRDGEFENDLTTRAEVESLWKRGWDCLEAALGTIDPNDMDRIVYIRNQGHTVMEALLRQLAHYPYHVGQMVYLGKLILDDQWVSLSIPKGMSGTFNAAKFAEPKHRGHFTDGLLKVESTSIKNADGSIQRLGAQ